MKSITKLTPKIVADKIYNLPLGNYWYFLTELGLRGVADLEPKLDTLSQHLLNELYYQVVNLKT